MKVPLFTVALALSGIAACAAPPAPRAAAAERRVVELPAPPGAGAPREVRVLVDEPALKLASITLRGGTALPTHQSAVPVTIVALQGRGTVVAGTDRMPLDPHHAVFLAPNVPHAVEPEPGADLVLLVHHLGRGEEHHR